MVVDALLVPKFPMAEDQTQTRVQDHPPKWNGENIFHLVTT
jgi:hypothetical protein